VNEVEKKLAARLMLEQTALCRVSLPGEGTRYELVHLWESGSQYPIDSGPPCGAGKYGVFNHWLGPLREVTCQDCIAVMAARRLIKAPDL